MKTTLSLILFSSIFLLSLTKEKHSKAYKQSLKVLNGFCSYIPSGNAVVNEDTVSVQGFYMSVREISNIDYLEFLHDLRKKGQFDLLEKAKIDTAGWFMVSGRNTAYAEHYHRHPAYREYPVVNVSKEGAQLYCDFLTKAYDSISNGELKIKFRLPTKAEFLRAGRGDDHYATYPWKGPYLRNSEGQVLCNFLALGPTNITRNEDGKFEVILNAPGKPFSAFTDVLAPCKSYWPNEFGIYNMSGNVAEMLGDEDIVIGGDWRSPGYDVQLTSTRPYKGSSPWVGFRVVATIVGH